MSGPPPPSILVSAGPSRESLDDVRFISNASSGRLGIAVAAAAAERGWTAHLALGPSVLAAPPGVELHPFESAADLDEIARALWPRVDAFVATAAVCDFRPRERWPGKRKKGTATQWQLTLERTPDVLARRAQEKGDRTLIGFALEATLDRGEALRKLRAKNLDVMILNTVANMGRASGHFEWIEAPKESGAAPAVRRFASFDKEQLAREIVGYLADVVRVPCSGEEASPAS